MVRRLKKDVQTDLPPKIKTDITIQVRHRTHHHQTHNGHAMQADSRVVSEVQQLLAAKDWESMADERLGQLCQDPSIIEGYAKPAETKIVAAGRYVEYLLEASTDEKVDKSRTHTHTHSEREREREREK